MKKKALKSGDSPRRVLARVLADDLSEIYGSATWTSLDGSSPDMIDPVSGEISEAATSESIPDS